MLLTMALSLRAVCEVWVDRWVAGGMGVWPEGWVDRWAVCEVWVDRWAEGWI
jgi:hypothetical protein